jgi:hypothetical protein
VFQLYAPNGARTTVPSHFGFYGGRESSTSGFDYATPSSAPKITEANLFGWSVSEIAAVF